MISERLKNQLAGSQQPFINDKSRKIAESKRTTNTTVHERLHQQALQRQMVKRRDKGGSPTYNPTQQSVISNSFHSPQRFEAATLMRGGAGAERFDSQPHNQSRDSRGKSAQRARKGGGGKGGDSLNYGIRLYQKGVKKMEEMDRLCKEAKAIQEKEECEELTFQPQINPISRLYGRKNTDRPEEHLLNAGRALQERIEKKRSEILFEEQNQCRF